MKKTVINSIDLKTINQFKIQNKKYKEFIKVALDKKDFHFI